MQLFDQNLLFALAFAILIGIALGARTALYFTRNIRHYFGGGDFYRGYRKYGNMEFASKTENRNSRENTRSGNNAFGFFLFMSISSMLFFMTKSNTRDDVSNTPEHTLEQPANHQVNEEQARTVVTIHNDSGNKGTISGAKTQEKSGEATAFVAEKFILKFGSFRQQTGAERLIDQLQQLKVAVQFTTKKLDGQEFFVVYAGPFSRGNAEKLQRSLDDFDSIVMPYLM